MHKLLELVLQVSSLISSSRLVRTF